MHPTWNFNLYLSKAKKKKRNSKQCEAKCKSLLRSYNQTTLAFCYGIYLSPIKWAQVSQGKRLHLTMDKTSNLSKVIRKRKSVAFDWLTAPEFRNLRNSIKVCIKFERISNDITAHPHFQSLCCNLNFRD